MYVIYLRFIHVFFSKKDERKMHLKGYGRKQSWHNLRYYLDICLDSLKKLMKNFRQESRFSGRDFKPVPAEKARGVLTTAT
jgi:hypothetical protein